MGTTNNTYRRLFSIRFSIIVLILSVQPVPCSFADLILTAPPRETPDAGNQVYAPLAKYLSTFLGEPVVYEHPQNWKQYEQKMKNDEYDIIFDGPHFAAWRIDTDLATPLIKLPGSLRFVLVVEKSNSEITQLDHMIGKTICTLPAPNLGALTLFSMFPYPARQPEYRFITGGFKEVNEAFMAGKCDGAILRSSYYFDKTDPLFRETTRVIKRSQGLTNQGITISKRVKPEHHDRLVNSLLRGDGKSALQPILERFYSTASTFVPASAFDYKDQNLLRDTVIYGW